ncbi:MAG TPA: LysR family transcriptional regulator [Burkholderiales bacterium]|nr:LysR family transcriptional regulator [Burkholderiales bacterium]
MQASRIRRYLRHGMLPQLQVFEAVTRNGSFTRAAEELFLAQPTVSGHIRKLTETVGLPLLEQVGKRVHPTSAGRELYGACQGIFRMLERVEDTFANMRGLKGGTLRLASATAGKWLATRMLAAFAEVNPDVEVSLHVNCRQELLARLGKNEDDLYLLASPPEDSQVVAQRILPNPLVMLARTDHVLAREKEIPLARFAQEPLLIREPGSGTRLLTEQLFARHGLAPKIRMELGSDEAILEAIQAGLGVSILSRHSFRRPDDHCALAPLDVAGFPLQTHWHFVYPVGKQLSFAVQSFLDFARKHAQRADGEAASAPH